MIHSFATRIAAGLVNAKVVEDNMREVYTYGLELIISALINVLLMVIVSVILSRYYHWLLSWLHSFR